MDPAATPTPLPDLVLWRGDGCHLCDDARALVTALLAERVIFMDNGRFIFEGHPEDLFSERMNNPRIKAFLAKVL